MRVLLALLMIVMFSGCVQEVDAPPGMPGFEAIYRDDQFREFTFNLTGPVDVAGADGQRRPAFSLNVLGPGPFPDTTFYMDGAWNVVRIDRHCHDGGPCNYSSADFPQSRLPAPFGMHLDGDALHLIDEGTNVTVPIVREDGWRHMEFRHTFDQAWLGWTVTGSFPDAPLPYEDMVLHWPGDVEPVPVRLVEHRLYATLPSIPVWPGPGPRLADAWTPTLERPWLGHDFPLQEAFDALQEQSDHGADVLARGCMVALKVDAPLGLRDDPVRPDSPDYVGLLGIDGQARSWNFDMQRGGEFVTDVAGQKQWMVRESEDAFVAGCERKADPRLDPLAWIAASEQLFQRSQLVLGAELNPSTRYAGEYVVPHGWRDSEFAVFHVPEHVALPDPDGFVPGSAQFIPYIIMAHAGSGDMMRIWAHPDDIARLDGGVLA